MARPEDGPEAWRGRSRSCLLQPRGSDLEPAGGSARRSYDRDDRAMRYPPGMARTQTGDRGDHGLRSLARSILKLAELR